MGGAAPPVTAIDKAMQVVEARLTKTQADVAVATAALKEGALADAVRALENARAIVLGLQYALTVASDAVTHERTARAKRGRVT